MLPILEPTSLAGHGQSGEERTTTQNADISARGHLHNAVNCHLAPIFMPKRCLGLFEHLPLLYSGAWIRQWR